MSAQGRFTVDGSGVIVASDERFAEMLRTSPRSLVGTRALDLVAPADRDTCFSIFQAMLEHRRPTTTVKRLIRADNTFLWLRSAVAYGEDEDGAPLIEVAAEPATMPGALVEPNKLLRIAEFLDQAIDARAMVLERRLVMDAAWTILLKTYMSEARGLAFDPKRAFAEMALTPANAARWVRTLIAEDLLVCDEPHDHAAVPVDCAFHLTPGAHERVERYLADLYHTLTPADRDNMPA